MYGLHHQYLLCLATADKIFGGDKLTCIHHLQPVAYYKAILSAEPSSPLLASLKPNQTYDYYRRRNEMRGTDGNGTRQSQK